MATDATGTRSVHNTLTGTTVDTVTLQGTWAAVEVVNWDASDTLWVTVGHQVPGSVGLSNAEVPADPVASANETFRVPAGTSLLIPLPNGAPVQPIVKILGDGGDYSVVGHPTA